MLMVCGALRGSRHQPQHSNNIPVIQQNYVGPTNITFNCAFAALQPPQRVIRSARLLRPVAGPDNLSQIVAKMTDYLRSRATWLTEISSRSARDLWPIFVAVRLQAVEHARAASPSRPERGSSSAPLIRCHAFGRRARRSRPRQGPSSGLARPPGRESLHANRPRSGRSVPARADP